MDHNGTIEWTLPEHPCRAMYASKPYAERMRLIGILARHWLAKA